MKQFLYLDNDIVNSIIAQNEQGLIKSLSSEQESNETETDSTHGDIAVKGTVGGSLFKLAKAEADLSSNIGYDESSLRSLYRKHCMMLRLIWRTDILSPGDVQLKTIVMMIMETILKSREYLIL